MSRIYTKYSIMVYSIYLIFWYRKNNFFKFMIPSFSKCWCWSRPANTHVFNLSTSEAEAGGSWVRSQPGYIVYVRQAWICSETLSPKKENCQFYYDTVKKAIKVASLSSLLCSNFWVSVTSFVWSGAGNTAHYQDFIKPNMTL